MPSAPESCPATRVTDPFLEAEEAVTVPALRLHSIHLIQLLKTSWRPPYLES